MSTRKKTYRITLLETLAHDSAYELSRGVIEYKTHSPHWRFVGGTKKTFLPYNQISPAETDGVIGWFESVENMRKLIDAGVAVVSLASYLPNSSLPCVCEDVGAIGRMGAEYLLNRGFEHFGFFTPGGSGPLGRMATTFREVIEHAGGRPCHLFTMTWTNKRTERPAFLRWLRARPKPIAIMAADDRLGRRVIEYAEELGLRVPDDVAVLGVGNDRWQCIISAVAMSSVDTNQREVGYCAATVLDNLLNGGKTPPRRLVPPTGVVTRASTDVKVSTDPLVRPALTYIREHCTESITVTAVANHLDVSRRTLQNRMKRAIGQTPKQAISLERLRTAKKLLAETNGTVQQVSLSCGFNEQAHFSRFFKDQTGERPGEYRQRIRRQ